VRRGAGGRRSRRPVRRRDTLYRVKKTSIYLEPELDAAIKRRADVLGISKAEAIRRAVARDLGVQKQPLRVLVKGGLRNRPGHLPGLFVSGT